MRGYDLPEGSPAPVRVVHVTETIHGGVGTHLRVLLPLQLERYRAGGVALIAPAGAASTLAIPPGVRVIELPAGGGRVVRAWEAAAALLRLLRREEPQAVHLHSTFAGLSCRVALSVRRRSPRVVYCAHGWAFDRESRVNPLVRLVERTLSRGTDAIVCVSDHDRLSALAAGLPEERLIVVRNGLPELAPADLERLGLDESSAEAPPPDWPDGALRLLFVGRLDRQKGLDLLLAALARVRRPVRLHVFGERVVSGRFDEAIPESVRLHGWADFRTIRPYLESCHALVMPSRWEGLPFTAIEAMRAAKAVIAAEVGGIPEAVRHGVTGLVVPAGEVEALRAAIEAADPDALAAMGLRGRELYLREFRAERMESDLARLYAADLSPLSLERLTDERETLPTPTGPVPTESNL